MLLKILLFIHVIAGFTALVAGPVAILTTKGSKSHRKWGMWYFWAMLVVFITGVAVSAIKFIPFLFMIAFFSFYQVFSGYRILFLKQLHKGQKAKWFDWFAAGLTASTNIGFIVWGTYLIVGGATSFFPKLALGFGFGGLYIVYINVKPFIVPPKEKQFWWFNHLANMMGALIATTTAFSTTIFRVFSIATPIAWIWPALIGIPIMIWWQRSYRKKFGLIT